MEYLQAYNNCNQDTSHLDQLYKNICYKLIESDTFIKIKI